MSDCTNVIINVEDTLEKRKGFVRAFDERFGGVICGLFKYTDEFGRERIIVADETGFSIREPFALPIFTQSDAYPFDNFELGTIDSNNWRNTTRYSTSGGSMVLAAGSALGRETSSFASNAMRWFKQQTSRSYQVRVEYQLNGNSQDIFVIIKGSGTLSGASILSVLSYESSSEITLKLYHIGASNNLELLNSQEVSGDTGFLQVQYNQATKIASTTLTPAAGSQVTLSSEAFNAIQDLDFGQNCGIGIARSEANASAEILVVDGGPI